LNIINNQPDDGVKKRFGVCSKKATFENRNFAIRFIEWVHMVRLLGAEKVHFSYDFVHPDLFEVIKHFEELGMVETWQYLNPTGISDSIPRSWQSYQLEVITQTDCFYKVMNLYDFIAIIDMDELIMPVMDEDMTWEDIIRRANVSKDAYVSRNANYPEKGAKLIEAIPKYMYMLQHVERSKNFSNPGHAVKSIFRTERVLTVHTHAPHHCLRPEPGKNRCKFFKFPTNVSQNSHYRDHMGDPDSYITQEDKTIWKFKDQLIEAVKKTLMDLNFVP
jgi:hypothetical protein